MRHAYRVPLAAFLLFLAIAPLVDGQATPGDPVHISWLLHVDPSPYDTLSGWNNGRFLMSQMAAVVEAHGGVMLVGTSWNFINGCNMFGNGPAFPGSLGDLAARGHEIAYHDHGGVSLNVATTVIQILTSPYTTEVYPRHLEGDGDFAMLASLGYQSTGGLCGKDIPTQLAGIFKHPVRRLSSNCYGEDPSSPIVGLGTGSSDGSGSTTDNLEDMKSSIHHAINTHTPGKLSFIVQGANHPDNWINATPMEILADMQILDAWMTLEIDPLISSGVLQWTTAATKHQLFTAWEAAGGSNADLFPTPNVTDPNWSWMDPTNSPLTTDEVDEVFVDSMDRLWVGGGDDGIGGLSVVDGGSWTTYDPGNSPLNSHRITSIAEGPPGVMWFLTGNDSVPGPNGTALHRFDGTTWSLFDASNAFLPNENFLFDVTVDDANVVWVGGKRALYRYDGAAWSNYTTASPAIPDHTGIFCLAPESDTVLWLGLRNGGVVRLDHQGDALVSNDTSVVHDQVSTGGVLPADTTYAITIHPDGSVFAGTRRGLAVLSGSTWTVYQSSDSELGYDQIIDMTVDGVEDVWIATYGGGLSVFRPGLGRFQVNDIPNGTVHARLFTSVAVAADGTVYAGGFQGGGISVYSPPALAGFAEPKTGEEYGLTTWIPGDAGLPYAILAALSTNIGIPLPFPDPRVFPLDNDFVFQASLNGSIAAFSGFFGTLDVRGSALSSVAIPDVPLLSGFTFHVAGATLDTGSPSGVKSITGVVDVTIL